MHKYSKRSHDKKLMDVIMYFAEQEEMGITPTDKMTFLRYHLR